MSKEKEVKKELNYFEELNKINVSDKIEKKNGLSYLSWSFAWSEIKKRYPDITFEVIKNEQGLPYRFDKATGYMVETVVTINNKSHQMWLPVMDGANKAMKDEPYTYSVQKKEWSNQYNKYVRVKDVNGEFAHDEKIVEAATMFDINSTIMRCLVKNIALHGLGLYIYAGEDLPQEEKEWNDKSVAELQREKREADDIKKGKADAKSREIQQNILDCGSVGEIDKVLEDEKIAIEYLEKNFKAIYNIIIKCKEDKIKMIDPDNEDTI